MVVKVEGTGQKIIDDITNDQLIVFLTELIRQRKVKSEELALRIEQYEKKRMAEEIMYRSMSSFRKLLTGKRPEHHLAVEHMVYVKRPLQEIDELAIQIRLIEQIAGLVKEVTLPEIFVPPFIANGLQQLHEKSER